MKVVYLGGDPRNTMRESGGGTGEGGKPVNNVFMS